MRVRIYFYTVPWCKNIYFYICKIYVQKYILFDYRVEICMQIAVIHVSVFICTYRNYVGV